jgi:CubicO group peptidase (beta-lactamase class C family)
MKPHALPALVAMALMAVSRPGAAPLPAGDPAKAGFSSARLERVHTLVQGYIDDGRYAGAITLIARDGRVVDTRTYGFRDVAGKLPMERDTLIYIYSLTKVPIAVATLTLYEEGRFGLDDPVARYLPEFGHMVVITGGTPEHPQLEDARPITIRQLLSQTAGFAYDFTASPALRPYYQRDDLFGYPTLPAFARALAQIPLNHQPGEAFTYGMSYDVLGYLIEKLTGQPLETALRERIFAPLAMDDTSFVVPPEKRNRMARVYEHTPGGQTAARDPLTLVPLAVGGRGFPSGGRGLISTADDYARFAQMLLNGGELDGARILAPKTVRFMTIGHLVGLKGPGKLMAPGGTYGFGVGVWSASGDSESPGSEGRFGWTGAATTYFNVDPQEGTVAILFAQHMPYDEFGLFPRFSTTVYQALIESRPAQSAAAVQP